MGRGPDPPDNLVPLCRLAPDRVARVDPTRRHVWITAIAGQGVRIPVLLLAARPFQRRRTAFQRRERLALVAPASLDIKVGNAFSRMFKRKRIDLETAERALDAYFQIPIIAIDIDLPSAVRLSHELNVYAYDAYVIDCASKRSAPLISLDGGLLEACRRAKIDLIEVKK